MPPRDGSDSPDGVLVAGCRAGDPASLDLLLGRYWEPLARFATGMLGERDAGEDVAQDTFVRFWRGRGRWQVPGSARPLLFQIARNAVLDELKRRRSANRAGESRLELLTPRTPDAGELTLYRELEGRFLRALADLPERRREIFLLVRFSGLSGQEIANALSIAPQTVANHMTLALENLREELWEFLPDALRRKPAPGR